MLMFYITYSNIRPCFLSNATFIFHHIIFSRITCMCYIIGTFVSTVGNVSDRYNTQVTPAGWTFSIWGIIYTWLAVWIVHGFSTICRRGDGDYLYISPDAQPPWLFLMFVLNMAANVSWLVLFDREMMIGALVMVLVMVLTIYLCLGLSHRGLFLHTTDLIRCGQRKEVWMIRIIAQNGLSFYCTWVSIATILNFTIVLVYTAEVSQDNAASAGLAILTAEILLFFALQTSVLDKFIRYTFSPYLVLVFALSGVLAKNWDSSNRNSIWTVVLICVAGLLLAIRLVLMVLWHKKRPLDQEVTSVYHFSSKDTLRMEETSTTVSKSRIA